MRSLLLGILMLLVAAPAASAAVTVSVKLAPTETQFGKATKISGTMLSDGAPLADRALDLEGRRYPFESAFAPLDHTTTAADGTYAFERMLDRNWQFRITDAAGGVTSRRVRAYVFPFTTLTFRARNSRVIKLTQRYRVPKGVKLDQPTLFYVGKRGRKTAPRVASGKLERIRSGRYTSSVVVRLPKAWNGRFRYASCFRYTGGSGMGNPRASCPSKFRF